MFKVTIINGEQRIVSDGDFNIPDNIIALELGRISLNDGTDRDDTGSMIRTAGYKSVTPGASYNISTLGYWFAVFFYDANKTPIAWYNNKIYKYACDETITAPTNASYIRMHCEDTSDTSLAISITEV